MKATKRIVIIVIALIVFALLSFLSVAFAHSGGTDEDGGHVNHSTGEYHYHHGEAAHKHTDTDGDMESECPYKKNQLGGSPVYNIVCFVLSIILIVFLWRISIKKLNEPPISTKKRVFLGACFAVLFLISAVIMYPLEWRASSPMTAILIMASPALSFAFWASVIYVISFFGFFWEKADRMINKIELPFGVSVVALSAIWFSFICSVW